MKILAVGDVEAGWKEAEQVIEKAVRTEGPFDKVVLLGDVNFGVHKIKAWPDPPDLGCEQVFIDGNHDNHLALRGKEEVSTGWQAFLDVWQYKPRGTIEDGILYLGGAKSIDKNTRVLGLDWWPQENISYGEEGIVLEAIDRYGSENIHTVFTHEAPIQFDVSPILKSGKQEMDHNRKFLGHIFDIVGPERWSFGHYHQALRGHHKGCNWRCVGLVDTGDFEVYTIEQP